MFDYWKKIDALNHINRLLLTFVGVLLLVITGLIASITQLPTRFEFWLTPSMSVNGGLIEAHRIPDEYVQGFVASMMPTLLTWSDKDEFSQNIKRFHDYFTPRHQRLLEETRDAYDEAQLFSRMQTASLYRFMEPKDVQRIGLNAWDVTLVMRLTQRLHDKSAMVIADKVLEYHVRVVSVQRSRLQNPFQLALDGYSTPEKRLANALSTEVSDD